MIKIVRKLITNNMHYKRNIMMNVKGIVLHSVGCPQPNPDVFFRVWNVYDSKFPSQLVFGVDKAYEVLPCMEQKGKAMFTWHVGDANGYMIGAEMTEPSTIKYTSGAKWVDLNPTKTKEFVMATYKSAVEVFAQVCKFHGLNPLADGVILSHSECHKRGIGTNHSDVEHIWNKFGLSMNQFRKDVNTKMEELIIAERPSSDINVGDLVKIAPDATYYNGRQIPAWVKNQNWIVSSIKGNRAVINKNEAGTSAINSPVNIKFLSHVVPFKVRVSVNNLKIRTGPDTTYSTISYIPTGIYTIVEVNGKWGRLKSKQKYNNKLVDGWISLDYAKRV